MHAIKSIGPVLGIVAFGGLAILAFLLFQQARDIRRLREWAGRAPERAREAAEAVQAAAETSREDSEVPEAGGSEPGARAEGRRARMAAAWASAKSTASTRWAEIDRRLPLDGRYLLAGVAVVVIALGVATSGFGLVGGGSTDRKHGPSARPSVAVLNGTSVPHLAAVVDKDVVGAAGYKTGVVTNTGSSFASTVVMYLPGHRVDAKALAAAVRSKLGRTPTQLMTSDVQSRAGGAPLALAIGLDDSQFGGSG